MKDNKLLCFWIIFEFLDMQLPAITIDGEGDRVKIPKIGEENEGDDSSKKCCKTHK